MWLRRPPQVGGKKPVAKSWEILPQWQIGNSDCLRSLRQIMVFQNGLLESIVANRTAVSRRKNRFAEPLK